MIPFAKGISSLASTVGVRGKSQPVLPPTIRALYSLNQGFGFRVRSGDGYV